MKNPLKNIPGKKTDIFTSPAGKRLYHFARDLFLYRLTPMGRYLIILAFFLPPLSGFIVGFSATMQMVVYFYAVIFFITPLFSAIFFPKLKVSIITPPRTGVESRLAETVIIENLSGKPAYFTYVRESNLPDCIEPEEKGGAMIPFIPAHKSVSVNLNLRMNRRGLFNLSALALESPYPAGVFKSGYRIVNERDILVYPKFSHLVSCNIPAGRKLQPGGIALASNVGESTEFLGTREFRTGDDPRYIHWKSWARLGEPVIKEFQEEFFTRIAIFIDTLLPENAPASAESDFEAGLSLTASISDYLERQEYIIDIIAVGPEIFYLQAGRSLACLDQILDILAVIEPCREEPYSRVAPHLMNELFKISTMVIVLLDWDENRKRLLTAIKDMGVEMRVFLVSSRKENIDMEDMESSLGRVTILSSYDIERGIDTV